MSSQKHGESFKQAFQRVLCQDMIIGAPASVGDVIVYDSQVFHWGGANEEMTPRYAFYVNYKNSSIHPGVHPDHIDTAEGKVASDKFRSAFMRRKAQQEKYLVT